VAAWLRPLLPRLAEEKARVSGRPEVVALLRRQRRKERIRSECGLFSVPKKSTMHRLVFDARPANALLERLTGFTLFSLGELLSAWSLLANSGPVHFWGTDFRHFFYQLRMPEALQAFFGVRGNGEWYVPQIFCMGFHNSPEVAQVVTWTCVFHREKGQDDLGIAEARGQPGMPRLVPIKDDQGRTIGFIFVLLDNVLVLASSSLIRDWWKRRILTNVALFNLEVKEEEEQEGTIDPKGSAGTRMTFAGVEFSQEGWRSASADRPLTSPEAIETRRQALQMAGALLWELRVRGSTLRSEPTLRRLYQLVANTGDGPWEGWDRDFHLSPEDIGGLQRVIALREGRTWTKPSPPREDPTVIYVATDATNRSTAHVFLGSDPTSEAEVFSAEQPKAEVAYLELLAIVQAARAARRKVTGPVELRLATDSAICAAVVEKGYSKSATLDPLLDELEGLRGNGVVVMCIWLPSAENIADIPSRRVLNRVCRQCEKLRHTDYVGDIRCVCPRPVWEPPPPHHHMSSPDALERVGLTRRRLCLRE
jgi:hypothetical protein